jgi:hypothetical protein
MLRKLWYAYNDRSENINQLNKNIQLSLKIQNI